MTHLLLNIALVAMVQALLPNHWLPLVALAKSENWRKSELMFVASISACAHVLGTVIVGIPLGMGGANLTHLYEGYVHKVAPVLLILFGLFYFFIHIPRKNVDPEYADIHHGRYRSRWILVFVIMMFLSPCLEVDDLFHAAGTYGSDSMILLAMLYAVTNIVSVLMIVFLAFKGIRMLHSDATAKYEKMIAGILLVGVGVLSFFIH